MFWCEHFEEDFKYRPIFKEVNKAILFSKGEVGLIVQQVVPSLTVLEKRRIFIHQCVLSGLRRSGNRQTAGRNRTRKSCDRLLSEEDSASLLLACENIRFSSLFAAGDVSRETSPAAKSTEKRMFSQATLLPRGLCPREGGDEEKRRDEGVREDVHFPLTIAHRGLTIF